MDSPLKKEKKKKKSKDIENLGEIQVKIYILNASWMDMIYSSFSK